MTCIFCKIIKGEIPCKKVYEDDSLIVFHDIHPKAPVHVLVVPKEHIESLAHLTPKDQALVGYLTLKLKDIAQELNLHDGFKTMVHTGVAGGQEVPHLHYHILGQVAT
jgi:histidine triad (HIT) family protein